MLFFLHSTNQNESLLSTSSRVTIAVSKFPSDATLKNYDDLQTWMYLNASGHSPIDLCQSIMRMFLIDKDQIDYDKEFSLRLIFAETYQTIGDSDQAYSYLNEAEIIAKRLEATEAVLNFSAIMERNRKRKKMEDIGMKLEFQSQFKINLANTRKRGVFGRYLPSL